MVGLIGLEPMTSSLSGTRSNHLSYRPTYELQKQLSTTGVFYSNKVKMSREGTLFEYIFHFLRGQSITLFIFFNTRMARYMMPKYLMNRG